MNHYLIEYDLVKAEQRERCQEAEQARRIRAAIADQPGQVEQAKAAPDQTDLVERVIQHVWKRLGLPARKPDARPLRTPSGELPPRPV